jgi:transcriptional regulator with XRE-family HTH domain
MVAMSHLMAMRILEKILESARRKGVGQLALERAADLPKNRISKWKDGVGEPTAAQALRIARVLGVPVEYLADDAMDEPPAPDVPQDVLDTIHRLTVDVARNRLLGLPDLGIGKPQPTRIAPQEKRKKGSR